MGQIDLLGTIQYCSEGKEAGKEAVLALEYLITKLQQGEEGEEGKASTSILLKKYQLEAEDEFVLVRNLLALERFSTEIKRYLARGTRGREKALLDVEKDEKERVVFSISAPCFFLTRKKRSWSS